MTYFLLKFIHIAAATIWIGGVVTLSVLTLLFVRSKDRTAILAFGKQSEFIGKAVIGPSAAITFIAGIVMVALVRQTAPFWIIWGFVVILVSMVLGGFFTNRLGNKITALASSPDSNDDQLQVVQRRMTLLNSIDIILLLSAVWVMVFKPTL